MMQPVVLGKPRVVTRARPITRVHKQVNPFVMQQCNKSGEHDRGRDCPSRRRDARWQADHRKASSCSRHRGNDCQARTDCIRSAQQQPLHVIWVTVMPLMGITRAQQFGKCRPGLGMKQPTVDDPFDRAERNNDRKYRNQVAQRPISQRNTDDDSKACRNSNHPARRRSGKSAGRCIERCEVPGTVHDLQGTSGARRTHIGPSDVRRYA